MKNLNNKKGPEESNILTNGPVFEFGPGWGDKTKQWIRKYILAADCSLCRNTRYVFVAAILIIIAVWPQFKKMADQQRSQYIDQLNISDTVKQGDGKIKVSRRILANFLSSWPDPELSKAQMVFIETLLSKEIPDYKFEKDSTIGLPAELIKSTILKSKSLSPTQIQYWNDAAKNVSF